MTIASMGGNFISATGGSSVASMKNLSNLNEFMSALNVFQAQYAYGENVYEGTNAFPAIVMSEPVILDIGSATDDPMAEMNFMLSAESALGDNEGLSFKNLTKRGLTETLLFKCRVIGHPDRPGPDFVLPLPDNMDLEDPATRTRIRLHKNFYWHKRPEDELPVLAIGDVVMIQFEDMRTFDNGYATHVIEKTENPGTVVGPGGISRPGIGGYNMNSLFGDGSARDIAAVGGDGPKAQALSLEQLAAVQPIVDSLCRWTGPYDLKDGKKQKVNAVYVNGGLVTEDKAAHYVILLRALAADGIPAPRFNSGFRPAWAMTVGNPAGRSPIGSITDSDLKHNTIGTTTPNPCKDWDGKSPSRNNESFSSQELLMWRMCNPEKGRRGQSGWPDYFTGEPAYGSPGADACKPACGRPSNGPHATGRAVDLNVGVRKNGYDKIKQPYKWLMDNAWRYGFVRTVPSERWHWEYKPGKGMFKYTKMDHSSWNEYFTRARYAPSVPTTVPATSPVLKEEDVVEAAGDL